MLRLFFILFSISLLLFSCGPSKKDAIKYNDQIVALNKKFLSSCDAFFNQIAADSSDSLQLSYARLDTVSAAILRECEAIPPFDGKREYIDASLQFFKQMRAFVSNEGKEITAIMTKAEAEFTEADEQKVNQLIQSFETGYDTQLRNIQKAQQEFSAKWKFDLK